MKNINKHLRRAVLALLLLMPLCPQAQYSHLYYHCQRDTIINDAETYYHSWWEFENSLTTDQIYHWISFALPTNKLLLYHFTDTPLQVVGLAIMPPFFTGPAYTSDIYALYDTTVLREYLYLCEAGVDTTYELAKVRWLPGDTSRFIRITHTEYEGLPGKDVNLDTYEWLLFYARSSSRHCCGGDPYTHHTNVAEYYFENPITVTDSFYVGCSNMTYNPSCPSPANPGINYPEQLYLMAWQYDLLDCKGGNVHNDDFEDSVCSIQWPAIWESHWNEFGIPSADNPGNFFQQTFPQGTYYHPTPMVPLVFPIVMVDTTVPPRAYCPKVENLQLSSDSAGCIDLSWDAFVNHRNGYDIYFGPANLPQSQWDYLYVENNFVQICDLDTNFFYVFRIAPVCDSLQNSPRWITSAPFRPSSAASDSVSVTEPSALARHTFLSPNPTTGKVHLHSDYVVTRLDLYDTQGRHLDNFSYPGLDTDLDLTAYPRGTYLLRITTSNGITTKKLLIQ